MTHSSTATAWHDYDRPGRDIAAAGQPGQPRRRYLTKCHTDHSAAPWRSVRLRASCGHCRISRLGSSGRLRRGPPRVYGRRGPRRPGPGVVAGQPARDAGVASTAGRRGHRRRARHRRRPPAPGPGRLVTTGPDFTGSGRDAGRAVLGHRRHRGRRRHRRARARHRPHGRPARRRARGEDPVRPGQPGVQRPAELRPGHRPAAARRHRRRHHLRGRPRRPDHRPAAGPGDARPDRPGRPGRGRRQPGRAGGGGVRAAQERGAGGPGGRRRRGSRPDRTIRPPTPGSSRSARSPGTARLAPFSSRHSYVSLTAPGVGLTAAVPPDGYARISSTSTSSGIVAGVAALILSRFPHLTVAQVGQALTGGTPRRPPGPAQPGTGHGTIDAAQAVSLAASIGARGDGARPAPRRPASRVTGQRGSRPGGAPGPNASDLAGSLVRYVVAGLCVLIVLLVALLLVMRSRRDAAPGLARPEPAPGRNRQMPGPADSTGSASRARDRAGRRLGAVGRLRPGPLAPPHGRSRRPALAGRAPGGWPGGSSLGEIAPPSAGRSARPSRRRRTRPGGGQGGPSPPPGPPWAPAPEPGRVFRAAAVGAEQRVCARPGPGIGCPGT